MNELNYTVKGLSCADCAGKIEEKISKMEGVSSVQLLFPTQELNIKVDSLEGLDLLEEKIRETVNSIEPGVKLVKATKDKQDANTEEQSEIPINYLLSLIPAAVLFIVVLALDLPLWLEAVLSGLSYLLAGWDIILDALKGIIKGRVFNEDFLMTIATFGAFAIKEFPEAAAVMIFFKTGEILEHMAVNKSRRSIKALLDIKPDYANVLTPDGLKRLNPDLVNIGDIIVVKPGEKVPLDGVIIEGSSFVDTSALTGESIPRHVNVGDTVLSGSVNGSGMITVQVEKSFSQSTVSRILNLVQNSASKKAPTENFITKFARYYTPAVVAAAILTAVVPPIVTGSLDFSGWFYTALVFLVISCPCALVISIPLSFFGGIGGASRKGILIKGGNYLEALNNVDTVVFDKTGTLTKGVFKVTGIRTENGFTEAEVLELAATAEVHSSHPIAKSIVEAYGKEIRTDLIESYEEIGGHGVKAVIGGREILVGRDRLLHLGDNIEHSTCRVPGTVVHVAVDKKYAGYITVADEIKEDSAAAISALKKRGISRVIMLSGDNRQTAEEVGEKLGIEQVYSELLPHQKVEQLELLKKSIQAAKRGRADKGKLLYVGDGINDAPVLAMADIGVAMGALGSDAAIEASDIVLMTDEPYKLVEAFDIAEKTRKIVWQNIAISLGVKLAVLALGTAGIATMWGAVFADVGVALIAVFNSLRLIKT